jgi:hypothetical protein
MSIHHRRGPKEACHKCRNPIRYGYMPLSLRLAWRFFRHNSTALLIEHASSVTRTKISALLVPIHPGRHPLAQR